MRPEAHNLARASHKRPYLVVRFQHRTGAPERVKSDLFSRPVDNLFAVDMWKAFRAFYPSRVSPPGAGGGTGAEISTPVR
jgi:hypothetical protein